MIAGPCFLLLVCVGCIASAANQDSIGGGEPPFVALFPASQKDAVRAFEAEEPRLFEEWHELYEMHKRLREMQNTFGTRKRKKAERMLPRAEAAVENAEKREVESFPWVLDFFGRQAGNRYSFRSNC